LACVLITPAWSSIFKQDNRCSNLLLVAEAQSPSKCFITRRSLA
jgi:hypothetical protein